MERVFDENIVTIVTILGRIRLEPLDIDNIDRRHNLPMKVPVKPMEYFRNLHVDLRAHKSNNKKSHLSIDFFAKYLYFRCWCL